MIQIIKGDVIKRIRSMAEEILVLTDGPGCNIPAIALIHQANCFNTMGSGVAKAIKANFPEVYEADCLTTKGDTRKLGTFSRAVSKDNSCLFIYNLYSQYTFNHFGKIETNLDAMRECLKKLIDDAKKENIRAIFAPYRIGCGLGGGDWGKVMDLFSKLFLDEPEIDLFFCKL